MVAKVEPFVAGSHRIGLPAFTNIEVSRRRGTAWWEATLGMGAERVWGVRVGRRAGAKGVLRPIGVKETGWIDNMLLLTNPAEDNGPTPEAVMEVLPILSPRSRFKP